MVGVKTKNKIDLNNFFNVFGKAQIQTTEPENKQFAEVETVEISEFRFAGNEYLLRDLETALRIFSAESKSARRVAGYIAKKGKHLKEHTDDSICFCYPTSAAYVSALNLADAVLMNERGEITDESLKTIADEFIEKHRLSNQLSDWLQERDAPLWSITIRTGGEILDTQIANAVQIAIIAAVWSAINPECHTEIVKA